MKSKLIACILGLSIILSSGTCVLAEAENASAGSAVQEAPVQQPQPEAPVQQPQPEAPADPAPPAEGTSVQPPATPENPGGAAEGGASQDTSGGNDPQSAEGVSGSEGTGSGVLPSGSTETGSNGDSSSGGSSGSNTVPGTSEDGSAAEAAESGSESGSSAGSVSTPTEEDSTSTDGQETEKSEKDEEEEKKEEVVVIGFSGIAEIVVRKKPSLKDAMTMLPTVVEAKLSDGNKIYVPVDWACASDYNDKKADRFTFGSSLKKNPDGTTYNIGHPIAQGVKFPTVDLVIKADPDKKDTEEKKDESKEQKDPVEEDKPLVMDDVTAANISAEEGEEEIFLYLLKELGLNKAAACGVLANIHYESGFNPHAIGDGGTSYGICQWHAGRYLSLVSFCNKIRIGYGSVEGQLKYMEQELENSYPHVLEYLKKVPETEVGAFDAAYYWCYHFERPAMILRQSTLRGNAAKNSYWPRYKDSDLETLEKKNRDKEATDEGITEEAEPVGESIKEEVKPAEEGTKEEVKPAEEGLKEEVKPEEEEKDLQAEALKPISIQTVKEYRAAASEERKAAVKAEMEDVNATATIYADADQAETDPDETSQSEPETLLFESVFVEEEQDGEQADHQIFDPQIFSR